MKNLIKLEIKKVYKPVLVTLIITTLLFLAAIMKIANNFSVQHSIEFWDEAIDYIAIVFPILAVVPTCWVMYYERKNKFLLYTLPRVSKKNYIFSKWIVCVVSAFLIIFVPMFIGGLVSLTQLTDLVTEPASYEIAFYQNFYMADILKDNTYLYVFAHCLWDGFLAMIVASLGFVFSIYLDNIFVILTGPFIYVTLDNFILAVLGFHKQRLAASFYINSMTQTNTLNLLVGPTIAILFIILLLAIFKLIKSKVYRI